MKIYCLFEQSNTFRDIWRGLGYEADSFDIEGNPSHKMDLFKEINDCYEGKRKTIFDDITPQDYVLAFFPCTYFETQNQLFFEGTANQFKNKTDLEKLEISRERERARSEFYQTCNKLFQIVCKRKIRLILENPYTYNYLLKTLPIKPYIKGVRKNIHRGFHYKRRLKMNENFRLSLGNETEKKACEILASHGWWVHRFEKKKNGSQPCDIVALRGERSLLIDGKHCLKPYLPTSRIEANQLTCFEMAHDRGVKCGFVCEFAGEFFYIDYENLNLSKPKQEFTKLFEDIIL